MNAENQQKLIAKYQELATLYQNPPELPDGTDLQSRRRWYRNCVLEVNNLVKILRIVELLIAEGVEDTDGGDDEQAYLMGQHILRTLWSQAARQRKELEKAAKQLGLTPPEWE